MTAPSAAKPEVPITAGSARGFRIIPCSAAPESDNVAPTSAASSTRGKRISVTMMPSGLVGSSSALATSKGARETGPIVRPTPAARKAHAISTPRSKRQLTGPVSLPPPHRSGEAWRSVAAKRDPDAGIGADPGRLIGEDLLIIFVQQVLNPAEQLHTVGEAVGAGEVHQDEIIQPNPRAWRRINKLVVLHPAIIVGAEIDVASAIEEPVV